MDPVENERTVRLSDVVRKPGGIPGFYDLVEAIADPKHRTAP